MSVDNELKFHIDRSTFFQIGRVLQRGIGKKALGVVNLSVIDCHLEIESDWGGGHIPCKGEGEVAAVLKAKDFCSLITTRYRESNPTGEMVILFSPEFNSVSVDRAGVPAKFPTK